jgi:CTP:molybdopterin cytidylyltransferase MocA
MSVAAVVLAAGAGRRFGAPKGEALLGTSRFVDLVVASAVGAGLDPIVVVVSSGVAGFSESTLVVENDETGAGLSRSLQLGLRAVPESCAAAVILLGDQPTMPIASVRAVLAFPGSRPLRAASASGRLGPPVYITRSHFAVAETVSGDRGLRRILASQPDLVDRVPVRAHPPDIDTAADLEDVLRRLESDA